MTRVNRIEKKHRSFMEREAAVLQQLQPRYRPTVEFCLTNCDPERIGHHLACPVLAMERFREDCYGRRRRSQCINNSMHGPVVTRRRCQACLERHRASDRRYQRRRRLQLREKRPGAL